MTSIEQPLPPAPADHLQRPIRGRVLVVDDDDGVARMLVRMLERDSFLVERAATGEEALATIAAGKPDIVLLDIGLPTIDGFEVCRRIKADPRTLLLPVVFITGLDVREHRIAGLRAGGDDFLGKPFHPEELEARVGSLVRLKHYTDELELAESAILSLALTVEARDAYTSGHCERLADYATALGTEIGLSEPELESLRRGAFLHDVGKIGIPDALLLKPSALTDEERRVMQRHTVIGEQLCGRMRSLAPVRLIVRHHHERLDGSGYPDRLMGDQIPLLAQVVGIVDAYDAMTTARPYRDPRTAAEAQAELMTDVQLGKFRLELVAAFLRSINRRPFGAAPSGDRSFGASSSLLGT